MKNFRLWQPLSVCAFALALSRCSLDKETEIATGFSNMSSPVFDTSTHITRDTSNSVQVFTRLSSHGNLRIQQHGWVWGENHNPTLENNPIFLGELNKDTFSAEITGLETGKVYYICPFVITACDTMYDKEQCTFLGVHFAVNTDKEIFKGADVQFDNKSVANCTYLWDFGDGDTSTLVSPVHTFNKSTGDVTVRLTADLNGCKVAKTMALKVIPDPFEGYWMQIDGGTFTMGCSGDQQPECNNKDNEMPPHSVTLKPFRIGKTEVTQAQWQAVMGKNPSSFANCGPDCPVDSVSWNSIKNEFIPALYRKTGRMHRLPSEAEWEYAARGGQALKYAGSGNLENVAWYAYNSSNMPHPVAKKYANGFGLHDMSGNVWEWVEDDYHDSYEGAPQDGSAWIDTPRASELVFRGGSWGQPPWYCRTAFRDRNSAEFRNGELGFRLARN